LSNAVKFTQEGGITVKLKNKDGMMQFSVKDTGIGIKREDLKKMFTEFCTISSHQELNPNGTGLGLYLSKKFAQLMNGTIALKSTYGKGSKFTVRIPLGEEALMEEELQEDIVPIEIPEGVSKHPYNKSLGVEKALKNSVYLKIASTTSEEEKGFGTVLIVDDNPMNSFVLGEMVNKHSLNVEKAFNGKEAIDLIREKKKNYSLILMDINMPIMSGPEVLSLILT